MGGAARYLAPKKRPQQAKIVGGHPGSESAAADASWPYTRSASVDHRESAQTQNFRRRRRLSHALAEAQKGHGRSRLYLFWLPTRH